VVSEFVDAVALEALRPRLRACLGGRVSRTRLVILVTDAAAGAVANLGDSPSPDADDPNGEDRVQNVGHVREPVQETPARSDAHAAEPGAHIRGALREARTEAVVVLAVDVALLAGLAFIDNAKGWNIINLPSWAWLLLAAPALLLIVMLLASPLAELSPGRVRNVGVALLGLLVASDAVGVVVLLAALAGSSTDSLSAGALLAHGTVVWLTNIITFGLLFWQLDAGGPRLRVERGRPDPDFEFPQDARQRRGWRARVSDYLYVSLTNAIAVSPTDTMPLTRRAKGLMAVESLISYAVVILVVARAVNVLGASS
jgi:uncharacterized membrane protein